METALTKAVPARLSPEEHRALGSGVVRLHKWQNCAGGTFGGVVHDLVRRGLMSADWRDEPSVLLDPARQYSVYTVTRAGRDAYVSYRAPFVPISAPT